LAVSFRAIICGTLLQVFQRKRQDNGSIFSF
jgi:hypothetical protein